MICHGGADHPCHPPPLPRRPRVVPVVSRGHGVCSPPPPCPPLPATPRARRRHVLGSARPRLRVLSCPVVTRHVPSRPVASRHVPSRPVTSRRVPGRHTEPPASIPWLRADRRVLASARAHRRRRLAVSRRVASRRRPVASQIDAQRPIPSRRVRAWGGRWGHFDGQSWGPLWGDILVPVL